MFVCSWHLSESDYTSSILALADVAKFTNQCRIKRLKIGSVPSRFQWNNWGLPIREFAYKRASTRLGHDVCPALPLEQPLPCEEEAMEEVAASVVMTEHDYGSAPKPGLQEKVLADMFQVSVSTVSHVVITWANYFYLLLGSLPIWMSKQQVKNTMPSKFVQYSPDVRVIIDCTEVRCQNPSSLTLQSEVFLSYKNMTTFKGLIGIAPCSAVTFVSSLFTGSISDRELTECGLLDVLEPGDGCMADKGFTIEKLLADHGATLIIPPFKMTAQFTKEDALKTQAIALLRILVERAIRRVKEYRIWEHTLPLTLSGTVNQLWTVCCVMTNFQGPLDLKGYIPFG
ncbi:hypothetical protein N1851_012839 [Merluccius polli]|uniref:DDE Tnp4 domain-containing protein n=1 Tax=Merluccius polli TaxID=89951 RepID=A0AA47MX60_MERPO|nr:hypothetical protein N1851_012839 [Merluccius polli]